MNIDFHKCLETLKINSSHCLGLIIVITDNDLLKCSNMCLLKLLIEHFFLEINEILVIHYSITVFIADSEDPQQCLLILRLQLLLDRVIQRSNRVKDSSLCRCNYINEVQVSLRGALDSYLDLFEVFKGMIH